ncbi:hypothetical protein BaRGS_00001223 [Batillaria attramentaria]|uniref:t-SNARE coiled-coil homology domain-containing protein n=1 Tax=Batillaria attramentaria TaxID=370345 RepID=A0ABD0M7V4_9CAEN
MASLQVLRTSESEESLLQAAEKPAVKAANVQKFHIKRLRHSIQQLQTVLENDLDRLQKHRCNIDKLILAEDWVGLHKEQVNSSRTVQQVKANLRELERARSRVYDDEVDQFDIQVQEVKVKAVAAVESFLRISHADQLVPSASNDSGEQSLQETTSLPSNLPTLQTQVQLHVVPENTQAAASWEELQQNMEELNELVHQFADTVEQQGESVDRIEDNIQTAQENVREGTFSLGKASKFKAAIFPVAGALIGGVVAGPVGFLAGAKIGLAGAVGGGVAGFAGGRILKSHQEKVVSVEMDNMRQRHNSSPARSASDSELSQPSAQSGTEHSDESMFSRFFSWGERKSHSESEG